MFVVCFGFELVLCKYLQFFDTVSWQEGHTACKTVLVLGILLELCTS